MDDKATADNTLTPVVAIAASAGGLEQITALLRDMPADTGAAFIVLQHLAPSHSSQLDELLARATVLPVVTIEDDMPVVADRVHVIPPGHKLGIDGERFRLRRDTARSAVPTLIDDFCRELAAARAGHAVGIILSGTGNDGALGLKAIKGQGGLTLVQQPTTAEHDGMPRAAIGACPPDIVADTRNLVTPLCNHLRYNAARGEARRRAQPTADADGGPISDTELDSILRVLREHDRGHDFASYKPAMLKRRIARRMGLRGLGQVGAYEAALERDIHEREGLRRDFLITVTDFFREPQAYEYLYRALETRLQDRDAGEPVRVWVPGCATGEEAYSIAMLLADAIAASGKDYPFVVFASDIDRRALATARRAVYPESIASDLSPTRLGQFCDKVDSHYQIKRNLREHVVFAEQNVIFDPPYSQLDLISCRNLLIYLAPQTQQRVLGMFHFALKQQGLLFLGRAENIGEQHDLFEPLANEHRLFERVAAGPRAWLDLPEHRARPATAQRNASDQASARPKAADVEQIARDILLAEHVPAAVLVNRGHNILCSYGPVGDYLTLPLGPSSLGLMEMAREHLRSNLRAVVYRAFRDGRPSELTAPRSADDAQALKITARPLTTPESARGLMLVTFEPASRIAAVPNRAPDQSDLERQLSQELEATRNELNTTIHALEASNEQLKGSNEEILSMNEELQSTNEELETSKEELQSLNEELTTVNRELEDKLAELERAHDDLQNLFSGTEMATLFVDRGLQIKRFTPETTRLLRLIASDIGRPLGDITLRFEDADLLADADAVMRDLAVRDKEVRAHDGGWYSRRVLPYRTRDNRIDGVVITFADITELKRAAVASHDSEQRLDMAMSAIGGGMWDMVIDADAPEDLPDTLHLSARLKGLLGFDDAQFPNSLAAWRERILAPDRSRLVAAVARGELHSASGEHYRIRHRDGSLRWFASYATVVEDRANDTTRWIGIECDITEHQRTDTLANALGEMVAYIDQRQIVHFTNNACNAWFGCDASELAGRAVAEVVAAPAYTQLEPHIDTALAGTATTCTLAVAHRTRGEHTLRIKCVPNRLDGEVLGFYAVATQITAHKRRATDALDHQSSLIHVHRLATVGQMTSTLAHDVKQPLSAINAYAETLARMLHAEKSADETTPILAKISGQTARAGDIVDQARAFLGHEASASEALDINEIVQRAVNLLDGRAESMNIEIRLTSASALPRIDGYAVQIEQIVVNLVNNAFDAMLDNEGGRILWLTTEATDGDTVRLSVTDSGPGIAPDRIAEIFETFHTTKLAGMGMGLAIARAIAESHGGRLWAQSQTGAGATFYLELPAAGHNRRAPAESRPDATG